MAELSRGLGGEEEFLRNFRGFLSSDPLAGLPDDDARFAALAIEEGLLSADALDECLKEKGDAPLCDVLLRKGLLDEAQVRSLRDRCRPGGGALSFPERVGRYRLLEPVGEGGMGIVFRARDEELGREVAVKMLKTAQVLSAGQVERFQREGRNTARLKHEGIVTFFDVGRAGDVVYYAMELIRGAPFDPIRGELRDRVATLEKVARAVHYAHEQGVIHRDLKPGNILVDEQGNPHLLDFGLSLDTAAGSQLTRAGAFLGTPFYMAPEQAEGRAHDVDARSDVYALGTILYEILAGSVPFPGDSLPDIVHRVASEPPKPPPGPRDLVSVCAKAMEKRGGDRYPTAAAFADDLARYLSGRPVEARPVGSLTRLGRWASRTRALLLGATLAILGGLVLGLWAAGRPAPPPPVPVRFQDEVHPSVSYRGTQDSTLSKSLPDRNDGQSHHLSAGGEDADRRARAIVVAWDLSSIPPGTRLESVTLHFHLVNGTRKPYEIYELKRPWVEGEVTWNSCAAGTPWEVPGARGPRDRNMALVGSLKGDPGATASVPLTAAGTAAVQSWIQDPASNHGFLIMDPAATDGLQAVSREAPGPERRPMLTVVLAR